jgi:hypothetical protein
MSEATPKFEISDENPVNTQDLRQTPEFLTADPHGEMPDVTLAAAPIAKFERPRMDATRVGIYAEDQRVGTLNVVQKPTAENTWVNDVLIDEAERGKRYAAAAYVGMIALAHEAGRTVRSDPGGLSPDSTRLWQSLEKRGVARAVEGELDQHGNPRFVSQRPDTELSAQTKI